MPGLPLFSRTRFKAARQFWRSHTSSIKPLLAPVVPERSFPFPAGGASTRAGESVASHSCSVAPLGARRQARSTRCPGAVSGPRSSCHRSPRARSFPPRPPQRANPLCSAASSVLFPRPTSHPRACSSFGCCLHEPVRRASPDTGEISQFPYKGRLHVHGVFDSARLLIRKPFARGGFCFPTKRTASAPRNSTRFAAQSPSPWPPL